METIINGAVLSLVKGDITRQSVDAIANAANSGLRGGGGVDGAIHRAGGPSIMKECCQIVGGCPTGSAVITGAGELAAKYVIHGVGPIYKDGSQGEAEALSKVYMKSLELALENQAKSIAFPSISTGVYGYPIKDAARVALSTVIEFLKNNEGLELVRFCLFSDGDLLVYSEALEELSGGVE